MSAAVAAAGIAVLVVLAAIDLRRRVVPNAIVLPATVAVLAAQCAVSPDRAVEWLAATFGTFALLLAVHLVHPPGLGMGDVKLGALLGALLGTRTPAALLVGALVLAAAGIVLVALRGSAARKTALPFAPFLAAGALAALLL